MRYLIVCLLGMAGLTTACQPLTPSGINVTLAGSKAADPTSKQELTKAPSISDSQDGSQTKTELAVVGIPTGNEANAISMNSPSAIPQLVFVAPKVFNPGDVIGLPIPALVREFGNPTGRRQEGTVEIWQYHFTNCIVDFFFYSINESNPKLIARSWDMRSTVIGDSFDRLACLAEINTYHQDIRID